MGEVQLALALLESSGLVPMISPFLCVSLFLWEGSRLSPRMLEITRTSKGSRSLLCCKDSTFGSAFLLGMLGLPLSQSGESDAPAPGLVLSGRPSGVGTESLSYTPCHSLLPDISLRTLKGQFLLPLLSLPAQIVAILPWSTFFPG